ncbi:hypothetical protein GM3709_3860 (plasmid) [Geminocystis sp. NIES-3709]|nr:hypothetical protein GM3709_3860 [Geminocystis sp. NIES-3709]
MVDKLKAHNKKYQYLKIYAEDKPPIYRKAKRLIGIAPIDCKLWVTEETTLAQITNLLADMKFCQQLPPVDEGKEWENFLRYNDYPDYI